MKKHIPNILSILRIALTLSLPFLMWEAWERDVKLPFINNEFQNVPVIWIIVFLVIILTDKLDGTLARKFKVESELGAILDTAGDFFAVVMGTALCFIRFVSLDPTESRIYISLVITAIVLKFFVCILAKIIHGKANMIHSFYHKLFAICLYPAIVVWAFLRFIPAWTIYFIFTVYLTAIIDETIYCIRSKDYKVDFKGHFFEKYELRVTKHKSPMAK